MAILSKIKSHSDVINYFKQLPFYNKPIEKLVKCLKIIDPLVELPFYEQLSNLYIGVKMQLMNLLKQFLKNINTAKKQWKNILIKI